MLLYIPFYFLAFLDKKHTKLLEKVLIGVVVAWVIVYLLFIDKSAYVIDDVEKPFITFLYFTSMLTGALFRKHYDKFTNFKVKNVVFLPLSAVVYFVSKFAFSRWEVIAPLQILNQFVILIVLYFIFTLLISLESKLAKVPNKINGIVKYVGGLTLQIYLVQFVIIKSFKGLIFPLNLAVVVILILAFASLVYFIEYAVRKFITAYKTNKKVKND